MCGAVRTWEGSPGPTSLWCGCVSTRSRSSTAMRPRGVRAKGSDVVKSVGPAHVHAALLGYPTFKSHTVSFEVREQFARRRKTPKHADMGALPSRRGRLMGCARLINQPRAHSQALHVHDCRC